MKRFPGIFCLLVATVAVVACGGRSSKNQTDTPSSEDDAYAKIEYPIEIDVSKDYPMEPIRLQEVFGEMEYVALETTPECLIAGIENPTVTDNDIFVLTRRKALFRFGRDGKFLNQIGREGRGPKEYLSATRFCVNDRTGEVFIYDVLGKNMLVYDFDGRHKRTLAMPRSTIIADMVAITDSTLLVSNYDSDPTKGHVIYPLQLISGLDGSVVKTLMPPHKEPNAHTPTDIPQPASGISYRTGFTERDPSKAYRAGGVTVSLTKGDQHGVFEEGNSIYVTDEGVMITEFVSDTVYVVSGAGGLTPRWVKTPSPMNMDVPRRRYSKLDFETERYAFFAVAGGGDPAGYKMDKSNGTITRTYLYDANMEHVDFPFNKLIFLRGINTGRFAQSYQALSLKNLLEAGKLSGELATIASTIKEDDNPVIMLAKSNK